MATKNENKFIKVANELKGLMISEQQNNANIQEDLITLDLINLGVKLFEWQNMPEQIPLRMVERNLFLKGKIAFFKDDKLGYFCLPFTYTNSLNGYGMPTKIKPLFVGTELYTTNNNLTKEYEIGVDCVVIRDNELELSPIVYAKYFGNKIAKLHQNRDKNNLWLNIPAILKTTGDEIENKKMGQTLKNIMFSNNAELAVITDAFNNLQLLNLKAQYFGAEIQEQIKVLKNDYLTFLGIDHREDKKERTIVDEIQVQQDETSINLLKRLEPRLTAIEEINKMFSLDIKLKINKNVSATENLETRQVVSSLIFNPKSKGGGEVGEVHDVTK